MENKVNESSPKLNINKSHVRNNNRKKINKKRRIPKRDQNLLCQTPLSNNNNNLNGSEKNRPTRRRNGFTNLIKHALKEIKDEKN